LLIVENFTCEDYTLKCLEFTFSFLHSSYFSVVLIH